MFEGLFEIVFEILLQAFGEILVELGWESARNTLRPRERAHPVLSGIGFVLAGAALGALSAWLWPYPVFAESRWPGINVIASPIVTGLVVQRYGAWSEGQGKHPSYLATFWGGALFAFTLAATRRWMVAGF